MRSSKFSFCNYAYYSQHYIDQQRSRPFAGCRYCRVTMYVYSSGCATSAKSRFR